MCRAGPQRRAQAPPASGSRWIRVAVISSTTTISIVIAVTSPLRCPRCPHRQHEGEERGTRCVIPDVSDITRYGRPGAVRLSDTHAAGSGACAPTRCASSWTAITAATDSAASRPTSTSSWTWAAAAGDAPPSRRPTNAPGRVTSPALRVWSSAGTRDRATARRACQATACRGRRAQRQPPLDLVPLAAHVVAQPAARQRDRGHRRRR